MSDIQVRGPGNVNNRFGDCKGWKNKTMKKTKKRVIHVKK